MILSTNVTFGDWTHNFGSWGYPGVQRIFDKLYAGGMRKAYWRFFYGGIAAYQSKIERVFDGKTYGSKETSDLFKSPGFVKQFNRLGISEAIIESGGYLNWDLVSRAIECAHKSELEFYAWISLENDHGGGLQSRLAAEHPEYAHVDRFGRSETGCLSFSFPEARAYKIALITEILQFPIDGIWLDFSRCAPGIMCDEDGISLYGYDTATVQDFRRIHGIDPHAIPNNDTIWTAFRARYTSLFMQELVAEIKKLGIHIPVYVDMPAETLKASINKKFVDMESLVKLGAQGIVAGYYDVEMPEGVKKIFRRRLWKAHPDILELLVKECNDRGFDEVMMQESDNLETENLWNTIARLSISKSLPSQPIHGITAMHSATPIDVSIRPESIGIWESSKPAKDFIEHTQVKPAYAKPETLARVAYDRDTLYVLFECFSAPYHKGDESDESITRVGGGIIPGDGEFVMLCLDPAHDHQTCSIIRIGADGDTHGCIRTHQEPLDHWGNAEDDAVDDLKFDAKVFTAPDRWYAQVRLPFSQLDIMPQRGSTWGVNFCRFIPSGRHISTTVGDHFVLAEAAICSWAGKRYDQFWTEPKDYGHLIFS